MKGFKTFLENLPSRDYFQSSFYKKYLSTLELYWSQRRRDAMTYLAKTIEDDFEHEDIHIFYRLWIELLSETHDYLSLHFLKKHLTTMAPQYSNYDQWAALRGLVHLELDEVEAVALILRAIKNNEDSPYALELAQRYSLRTKNTSSDHIGIDLSLLSCKSSVTDYFVLQTLARGLLISGEIDSLTKLLSSISQNYSHSPIEDEFRFWKLFEENKLKEAITVGKRLTQRFPQNENYQFNLAYTYFCHEEVEKAVQGLENFDIKTRKKDPDSLALLGYGYLLSSKDKKNSKEWEKAQHYLNLAKSQSKKLGIPSSETALLLDYMEGSRKPEPNPTFWLVPLSPRREYDLFNKTEQEIDYIFHELPKGVDPGDHVFLTSLSDKNLRILAIYKVKQTNVWNPYTKHEGLLELVQRMLRPVEIAHIDLKNRTIHKPLSNSQRDICLSQLEEFGTKETLKQPSPKHKLLKFSKAS